MEDSVRVHVVVAGQRSCAVHVPDADTLLFRIQQDLGKFMTMKGRTVVLVAAAAAKDNVDRGAQELISWERW